MQRDWDQSELDYTPMKLRTWNMCLILHTDYQHILLVTSPQTWRLPQDILPQSAGNKTVWWPQAQKNPRCLVSYTELNTLLAHSLRLLSPHGSLFKKSITGIPPDPKHPHPIQSVGMEEQTVLIMIANTIRVFTTDHPLPTPHEDLTTMIWKTPTGSKTTHIHRVHHKLPLHTLTKDPSKWIIVQNQSALLKGQGIAVGDQMEGLKEHHLKWKR